ncbi:MAG: hypothetical protein PHS96_14950 [Anaerolineales bacterium]|nr:hypothetical protein [Anaerolineales bacterium]
MFHHGSLVSRFLVIASLVVVCLLASASTARAVEIIDGASIGADQVIDDDVFLSPCSSA